MTEERLAKFERVVANRQLDLTIVLENVHDPHNIGAVLRSCDSVGIREIFILYTESQLSPDHIELGKSSSSGARKWIDVHYYTDLEACFAHVKKNYQYIFSTHLSETAKSLHQLDLTQSVALLFGNEKDGLSTEALSHSDGNFIIPQVGMVESLNISVACAVSIYEAYRQRLKAGKYEQVESLELPEKQGILKEYIRRHVHKDMRKTTKKIK